MKNIGRIISPASCGLLVIAILAGTVIFADPSLKKQTLETDWGKFQIMIPDDWSFDGSTFDNGKNEKVAEVMGVFPDCFSELEDEEYLEFLIKLIKKEKLNRGWLKGISVQEVAIDTGGSWIANTYCYELRKKEYVFLVLYEEKPGTHADLFDKISQSFTKK